MLQNLGFERVQISFYEQGHRKMISQLMSSERMSLYGDPRIREFHKLVAQIDILHQKLTKIWSRDTLICERVLGKWTPTLPGVEFWRTKIKFYCASHRKRAQQQLIGFARSPFSNVKMKILKKFRILA